VDTLETLTRRLAAATDLAGLVRTLKALSAVNLRQYERAIETLCDYARTVELGLRVAMEEQPEERRAPRSAEERVLIVAFGSDYGLCGQYNSEIAQRVLQHYGGVPNPERLIAVGARVADRLREAGRVPDLELPTPSSAAGIEAAARALLVALGDATALGSMRVLLVHHRRRAAGEQRIRVVQLSPVEPRRLERILRQPWPSRGLPIFTMEREKLASALLRQFLFVEVLRAYAQSGESEHHSRLTSLQASERNLDERASELRGLMRRRRQDAITSELLDIASGFEALRRSS